MVAASPLFDSVWYAEISGFRGDPNAAAKHYLNRGGKLGLTPHPLFDPAYFAKQLTGDQSKDPLITYLSDPSSHDASPHPLFDAAAYSSANPAAREHPLGPLGHYAESGCRAGRSPNDWYQPDLATEPAGLIDWVRSRRSEWLLRRHSADYFGLGEGRPEADLEDVSGHTDFRPLPDSHDSALVSILLLVDGPEHLLRATIESVLAQSMPDWELLVVPDDRPTTTDWSGTLPEDPRIRVLDAGKAGWARRANRALAEATGRFVAWTSWDEIWLPDRLSRVLSRLAVDGQGCAYDILEIRADPEAGTSAGRPATDGLVLRSAVPATPERLAAGWYVELNRLIVDRRLALEVGGIDQDLPAAADHDFVLKIATQTSLLHIPAVGAVVFEGAGKAPPVPLRERPLLDLSTLETWHDVVLNRHLIDWDALSNKTGSQGVVTVVIPTYDDWEMTTAAVRSVTVAAAGQLSGLKVEIIVVDNGCNLVPSVVLDSLPLRFAGVRVIHNAVNFGFALGNNVAMNHATGEIIVFLNNDTEVHPGWLEPLAAALDDPGVLGAQSLLIYPTGSIQSAGIAFPSCGGIPHVLLQGFPVEDADDLSAAEFSALTAAALAIRFTDVVALRGFDPLFKNGMEDVDLGLRMKKLRPGRFVVEPRSRVIHYESQTPGRLTKSLTNRRILLERWGNEMPGDDIALWRQAGFEVVRHEITTNVAADRRLNAPQPVLVRRAPVNVTEGVPRLRWAIKNPAPADPSAEFWGDTHFARHLATALRSLGQQVIIDHRPEFERRSGCFDDVVLVLRGLAPFRPQYAQINLGWLISHPDMLRRSEAASYDRLLAASVNWSERMSRSWGIRVDPLLQATDPTMFHPDRGVPDTGHPVLFVGSSRGRLRPVVRDAINAGLPLSIYGPEWEGLIPDGYVKAPYLPNEAIGQAYRSASIVLNDHWEDMRVDGFISNRLFDAAASGARVITDDVAGLGNIFGRSVQVARNEAELAELASAEDLDQVFGDDEERRKVAARIHAEHSFSARAQQLLDIALEVRSQISDSRRDAAGSRTGNVWP